MHHDLVRGFDGTKNPNVTLVESGRRLFVVAGGHVEQAEKRVREYEMKAAMALGSDDGSTVVVEEDTAKRDVLFTALENGERLRCNELVGRIVPIVEPGSESFLTRVELEDDD
jgi:hypothetical protein